MYCIELCVESVYVKMWEGLFYRETPTTMSKRSNQAPKASGRSSDFRSRPPCLRPEFELRLGLKG